MAKLKITPTEAKILSQTDTGILGKCIEQGLTSSQFRVAQFLSSCKICDLNFSMRDSAEFLGLEVSALAREIDVIKSTNILS